MPHKKIVLVLRFGDFLVMVRAVRLTPCFNKLYFHIKNLGQTNRQTNRHTGSDVEIRSANEKQDLRI